MSEIFGQPSSQTPEMEQNKEGVENLKRLFEEAEKVFETGGRDPAKPYLNDIYKKLQELNAADTSDWTKVWDWNKDGGLTKQEFNELNLRRKKLSNAIGILTADGTVRHDLNEI